MSLPHYQKYKDSNISWVGRIPEHWEVKRLKYFLERSDGGAWGGEPNGKSDRIVLRSTEQTVDGYWCISDPAIRSLSTVDFENTKLVAGDLLLTKSSGSSLHIGKTTLVSQIEEDMQCGFSNFMQRIRVVDSLSPKFLWFILNNNLAREQFGYLSNSTTGLANLSDGLIKDVLLTVPSEEEQKAILLFLDDETAAIDSLIAEQQRTIELLAEKRQAVISHAVTKGLNPKAEMKASGISLLGEVPRHWEVKKLGHLCGKIGSGKTPLGGAEVYTSSGVLFIRSQNVYDDGLHLDDVAYITEKVDSELAFSRVQPDDILLNITGASLGRTCVVPEDCVRANVNQHVCIVRIRDHAYVPYVAMLLKSSYAKSQYDYSQNGAAREGLSFTQISKVAVPLPPLKEQIAIIEYIRDETVRLNTLVTEVQRAIGLLQERRSALTSAAVTGKIDVRGYKGRTAA